MDERSSDGSNGSSGASPELPLPSRPDPYLGVGRRWEGKPLVAHAGSRLAPLALGAALASFVCLWAFGGFLAIGLGLVARRETNVARGSRDAVMALLAILLGGLNVVVSALAIAGVANYAYRAHAARQRTAPTLSAQEEPVRELSPPRAINKPVRNSRVGGLQVIDVDPGLPSLPAELDRQWSAANAAGEQLMLWTVGPACAPCDAVAQALPDPRMQVALAGVRILRLDAVRFQQELSRLRLPTQALPGFALIGKNGHAVDYVHGGEWDEDIAPNIAPVLGKFVHGEYDARRYPWRGGARDDETAL